MTAYSTGKPWYVLTSAGLLLLAAGAGRAVADEPSATIVPEHIDLLGGAGRPASPKFRTITLGHEISFRPAGDEDVLSNRSSLRLEYSKYFWDGFFARIDSKENVFWSNDHRAEAEDRTILLENITPEAFVQYSRPGGRSSFSVGIQKLIWGESEGGVITDVVSPRNHAEFFFIPLEESRLGQFMISADYFSGNGDWSAFFVPRAKFNKTPDSGTAYYVDPFGDTAEVRSDIDDSNRYELGMRWKKTFGRSDVSIMTASLVGNNPGYDRDGFNESGQWLVREVEQRYALGGMAFNYVQGDYQLKGEVAYKSQQSFNNAAVELIERDVVDAALLLTYSLGGSDSIGAEIVNRHILGWGGEVVGARQDETSLVLNTTLYFLNDTLGLNWLTIYNEPFTSVTSSLRTSYDWSDNLTFTLDAHLIHVQDERSVLYTQRRQDQVFLGIQYKF